MINNYVQFQRFNNFVNKISLREFTGRESFHQQINRKAKRVFESNFRSIPFSRNIHSNTVQLKNYWWIIGGVITSTLCMWMFSKKIKKSPIFSLEELEKHRTIEKGLWIAWQDPQDHQWYVSAMADFVTLHPGGERIAEAGGKTAMPYWQQFARHLDSSGNPTSQVLRALRSRVIGLLKTPPTDLLGSDPYSLEPDRSKNILFPLQSKPYNAGQKPIYLESFVTDVSKMFIRFHTPVPLLQNHSLTIETPEKTAIFTLETLKQYETLTYTSVMQCTGHRRSEMANTNGIQWEAAVANVEVKGYSLWNILHQLDIPIDDNQYFLAEQLDEKGNQLFSTCIPLKELPKKTLLAIEMNGEPLNRDHGGPLRLWVPGFNGNFSVKKIDRIKILSQEQAPADKVSKFNVLGKWAPAVSLSSFLFNYVEDRKDGLFFDPEIRVNSLAIAGREMHISEGTKEINLKGWAWSGGGREIVSVQISIDEGQTWEEATLKPIIQQPINERYAWTGWDISIPISSQTTQVLIRAKDSKGNIQPQDFTWNPRGLRNNSWTLLHVKVVKK